jgi:outer membrane lipoprotein-sorting protein
MNDLDPHDNPEDQLERAIAAMRDASVPDGPSQQVHADTLSALRKAESQHRPQTLLTRILTMKPLTKMAASVLLALGLSLLAFVMLRPASPAWADVVDKVASARTLTFHASTTMPGTHRTLNMKFLMTNDGRRRVELAGENVTISDSKSGTTVVLDPQHKTATVVTMKNKSYGFPSDPMEELKKLKDKDAKDLGEKTIDGHQVKGFSSSNGGADYVIWADKTTGDPVRIECTLPQQSGGITMIMDDFVINPTIDPALFDTTIPSDYKVTRLPAIVESITEQSGEEHVIAVLRGYAQRTGGKFPAKLGDTAEYATLVSQSGQKLKEDDIALMAHAGALTPFLMSLPKNEHAYLGEHATLGEKDKIVFWYQEPKTKTYRAVYADLTAREIPAGDVPRPTAKP